MTVSANVVRIGGLISDLQREERIPAFSQAFVDVIAKHLAANRVLAVDTLTEGEAVALADALVQGGDERRIAVAYLAGITNGGAL